MVRESIPRAEAHKVIAGRPPHAHHQRAWQAPPPVNENVNLTTTFAPAGVVVPLSNPALSHGATASSLPGPRPGLPEYGPPIASCRDSHGRTLPQPRP